MSQARVFFASLNDIDEFDSIPLFGLPHSSLPPFNYFLASGEEDLLELADVDDYIGGHYEQIGRSHSYDAEATYAALGGWHQAWLADDWAEMREHELIVTTAHGEPFLEVFRKTSGDYLIRSHVT